jgi:hypothetical protein
VAFQPVQSAGDDRVGCKLLEGADGICDGRLEQRPGEVGPADDRVQLADAGQALGVPANVDHADVPGSRSGRPARVRRRWRSAPGHLSQRVGCQLPPRQAWWIGNPFSKPATRSTSPVISTDRSYRNEGCCSMTSKPTPGARAGPAGRPASCRPAAAGFQHRRPAAHPGQRQSPGRPFVRQQQQVHGVVADDQHNQLVDRLERVLRSLARVMLLNLRQSQVTIR